MNDIDLAPASACAEREPRASVAPR
ncbi:MAG: hypothetical protein RL325_956, partial [Planctomycetota bacterium]